MSRDRSRLKKTHTFERLSGRAKILSALFLLSNLLWLNSAHAQTPATIVSQHKAAYVKSPPIAPLKGQSATLLPDGSWLYLGGVNATGQIVSTAELLSSSGKKTPLSATLTIPRSGHSASVLPDGSVLILGGEDKSGLRTSIAERYRPDTRRFESLGDLGLLARSQHSATLLLDGRLLIVGGIGAKGDVLDQAELLDTDTLKVEAFNARLDKARFAHIATLLPSDHVFIGGGLDKQQRPLDDIEFFDRSTGRFIKQPESDIRLPRPDDVLEIRASIPPTDAIDIPVAIRIALRFSKPLRIDSLSTSSITLVGPHGVTPIAVVPAEQGLLAFVTPQQELLPASQYSLLVQGAEDENGKALPFTAVSFKTASLGPISGGGTSGSIGSGVIDPTSNGAAATNRLVPSSIVSGAALDESIDGDEVFVPGPQHRGGRWRTNRPLPIEIAQRLVSVLERKGPIAYEHAFKNRAPGFLKRRPPVASSEPGIEGRVLRLNDRPLANTTIKVGGLTARTDAAGYFRVTGLNPGRHEVFIDGATAGGAAYEYGKFVIGVDVKGGELAEMAPIYLPRIRTQDWINITSPIQKDTIVTHPNVPGLEIHIPQGAVLRGRDGKIVTRIALVPLPLDRVPFPFPENAPVYVSVQPGGWSCKG